ncbi:MAG TPA: hydantoinase B/oxoprolinase family protein [bacterium]|nr:hydantoinase B/oxoprolinase family protein [bacterium]
MLLEILHNRFQAVTEEMASTVLRTGFTVFVKETGDFSATLVTREGEVFAAPLTIGTTNNPGKPHRGVIEAFPDWAPGDVVLTNDPYTTGGLVTHLADLYLIVPIFADGRLLCFASCFVHSSDVGGKVPGSISPTCYDIFQEGFRLRPVKLYERGALNAAILRLVLDNCRIPTQNWGDLKALLACVVTAERRMQQLVDRYGFDRVEAGIVGVLDWAERRARQFIEEIPDGVYEFWDYLEGDAWGGAPMRLRCRMEVRGSELFLDFTGTDHQVRGAFNLPSLDQKAHAMFVPTICRYFRTRDRGIPYNSGLVRPVHTHAPRGSMLNPQPPAAVGVRAATMIRIMDVMLGLLGQALPSEIPAAGAGQACVVLLAMYDPRTGGQRVGVIQPIVGGSGGRPMRDGIDGMDFCVGFLRNVPAETLETDMPILIERYGLRPDSGGPGRYRGGMGIELALRVLSPDTVLTARGMERIQFRPWGRLGGAPGVLGHATVTSEGSESRDTGKIDELLLQPGETVAFYSQGGGGYGDPFERDPDAVARDVRRGLVTLEAAVRDYGVVLSGVAVDTEGTSARRRGPRSPALAFSFGPERNRWEAVWSDKAQLALHAALDAQPPGFRSYMREALIRMLGSNSGRERPVRAAEVADAVRELRERIVSLI